MVIANGKHYYAPIETSEIEKDWNDRYNYVVGGVAGARVSDYVVE